MMMTTFYFYSTDKLFFFLSFPFSILLRWIIFCVCVFVLFPSKRHTKDESHKQNNTHTVDHSILFTLTQWLRRWRRCWLFYVYYFCWCFNHISLAWIEEGEEEDVTATATALVEPRARSGRSAATERRRRRKRTLNQSSETLIKRQPHTHTHTHSHTEASDSKKRVRRDLVTPFSFPFEDWWKTNRKSVKSNSTFHSAITKHTQKCTLRRH